MGVERNHFNKEFNSLPKTKLEKKILLLQVGNQRKLFFARSLITYVFVYI